VGGVGGRGVGGRVGIVLDTSGRPFAALVSMPPGCLEPNA
jgi:hypothetical protein